MEGLKQRYGNEIMNLTQLLWKRYSSCGHFLLLSERISKLGVTIHRSSGVDLIPSFAFFSSPLIFPRGFSIP